MFAHPVVEHILIGIRLNGDAAAIHAVDDPPITATFDASNRIQGEEKRAGIIHQEFRQAFAFVRREQLWAMFRNLDFANFPPSKEEQNQVQWRPEQGGHTPQQRGSDVPLFEPGHVLETMRQKEQAAGSRVKQPLAGEILTRDPYGAEPREEVANVTLQLIQRRVGLIDINPGGAFRAVPVIGPHPVVAM